MNSNDLIPDAALGEHLGIFGTTGSGKSFTARGLIERVMAPKVKPRMLIIDPKGDWWGARLASDGKGPGLPLTIIGGPHADQGLRIAQDNPEPLAKPLGHMIAKSDFRGLLDVSDLDAGKMRRFIATLLNVLYHENREQLYLVMDEADEFAPMKIGAGEWGKAAGLSLGATERIAKRGRTRGFVFWPITQRPASVHTDIRGMMQSLVIQRLTLPHDRKAIREWFDGQMPGDQKAAKEHLDAVVSSLPQLETGEGWAWCSKVGDGTPVRGRFPMIATFDSMKAPKPGDKTQSKPLPPIDTTVVTAALAEAAKEAIERDPKVLLARIDQLEAQLAEALAGGEQDPDANGASAMQAEIDRLEEAWRSAEAERDELRRHVARLRPGLRGLVKAFGNADEMLRSVVDEIDSIPEGFAQSARGGPRSADVGGEGMYVPPPRPAQESHTVAPRANGAKSPQPGAQIIPQNIPGLSGPESRVLAALSACAAFGLPRPARQLVAACAGYSPTSTSFTKSYGALRTRGLVEYPDSDSLALTTEGRQAAPTTGRVKSLEELHDRVLGVLTGPEHRILSGMLAHGNRPISRDAAAERAGYSVTSTSFTKSYGSLKTKGFVTYPDSKSLAPTAALFPPGLK